MVLSSASVPYDIVLAEDMLSNPEVARPYKALLMVGCYRIDDARRKFIENERRRGAKLLFTSEAGVCGGADALPGNEVLGEPMALTPKGFNGFARDAGAYVPAEVGLQVDMNGNFVCVHCIKTGRYDFELPFAAEVVNLKSGEKTKSTRSISLDMTGGETRWYSLARSTNRE